MKKIFFAISLLAVAATASAAEFADTSVPDQMIEECQRKTLYCLLYHCYYVLVLFCC